MPSFQVLTSPSPFAGARLQVLERTHGALCRHALPQLTSELGPVDLELVAVTTGTWADALDDLSADSLYATVRAAPIGTTFLLAFELHGVLGLVTRLLGGAGPGDRGRLPTDIELVVARRVLDAFVRALAPAWRDLLGLELSLATVDVEPALQLATADDPSLLIRFDVDGAALSLAVPYRAIEQVADRLPPPSEPELDAAVAFAEVELRAEVGAVELSPDAFGALAEGDLIPLGVPASSGVTLHVEGLPLHRGLPGRSGRRRAIHVVESLA